MKLAFRVSFLILSCAVCQPAAAQAIPGEKIGVVLMHGKWGLPGVGTSSLASALRKVGALVEAPEMPWSRNRAYAKSYGDSMMEIDAAVERLRAKGAKRIVVGGLSLGASAALGYGARRDGLAGIILLAPGSFPGLPGFQARVAHSVAEARRCLSQGRGDACKRFADVNQGRIKSVSATAHIYLSWFAPDGPAVWTTNAAKLKSGTPVFCADGTKERYPRCWYATSHLPSQSNKKIVSVNAAHRDVPDAARQQVVAWLRDLK